MWKLIEQFVRARRAVTINDAIATGTLIVLTVGLAAGLGASVLIADDGRTGPPSANFTFEHFQGSSMVIVTHSEGDAIPAGELVVSSGETSKTWATIGETNNTTMVSTGSSVSLSENSPFGKAMSNDENVAVQWTDGNQTKVLDRWPDEEGDPIETN